METISLKERVNNLVCNVDDFINALMWRSARGQAVKLARNSMVEKFTKAHSDLFVLFYNKDIPIAFYDSDGDFYDLTELTYFRTKKTERIIRKFQKEYAPNFSVYYVYRY